MNQKAELPKKTSVSIDQPDAKQAGKGRSAAPATTATATPAPSDADDDAVRSAQEPRHLSQDEVQNLLPDPDPDDPVSP